MFLLLCLLGKLTTFEAMRPEPSSYYYQGDHHKSYHPQEHAYPGHGYQQMGGLRRLQDTGAIRTHFYPEGGWGWIVCACAFLAHVTTSGAQLSAGALHIVLSNKFQDSTAHHWLGPVSWSVSSIFSPLIVNLCRRKNVRVLSLVGGILFPLSLLITSFCSEMHQIFFSFGLVGGIGSCMVRESSGVVLGEFFRKRRQFVEQVVMAGTGVGVTLFSLLYLSFTRHLEWGAGFRVGAAFASICVLLPAFYRTASKYQPRDRERGTGVGGHANLKQRVESPKSPTSSMVIPIGGDICRSLQLFCVPSLKPLLWSAAISSFGLYAPVFLMADFGRSEGLPGGSLLLLQTHLGLGLSLGVILGAILTLKKFRSCQLSPRILCTSTACLTGLSMIAISSVKGYYGYSLSAWIYGVALGSHLYTLKVLTMELTRTKHWSRIWSLIESIMSPGILLGSGLVSYVGKEGFYACACAVLIGAGLLGFQIIDITKCSSPQLSSSADNDSPIPPAPPPISAAKYGLAATPLIGGQTAEQPPGGLYPLRRSISLQQQQAYPPCSECYNMNMNMGLGFGYPPGYSPYCRDCVLSGSPMPPNWGMFYQPTPTGTMIRSYSLPQTGPVPGSEAHHLKSTGTQTNPNSPVRTVGTNDHVSIYPGSYDRLPTLPGTFLPQDRVIKDIDHKIKGTTPPTTSLRQQQPGYKQTVMFASNPQLFPVSATQSSATSTTDQSATPTYGNHYHSHAHHDHQHHAHHHHKGGSNLNSNNQADQDSSRGGSPRHYYPQKEERRANVIRGTTTTPTATAAESKRSYVPPPPILAPSHHHVVTVETHKKPIEPSSTSTKEVKGGEIGRQKPAFTRHYFDSSKIQKGSAAIAVRNMFQTNINQSQQLKTSVQSHIHNQHINNNFNNNPPQAPTTSSSSNIRSQYFIPQQQQQQQFSSAQQPSSSSRQTQQSLPLSVTAINAKLAQYQRQQTSDFSWRNIQRQSASSSINPFENDDDPPYLPSALASAHKVSTKVSGHEFDVEQPKFNSLRKSLNRSASGQNSSVSSQLNYSVTPTPVHQRQQHQMQMQQQQQQQGHPQQYGVGASYLPYHQQHHYHHQHHHQQQQRSPMPDFLLDRERDKARMRQGNNGNLNDNINNVNNVPRHSHPTSNTREDCPYCDPGRRGPGPPPLSLSVPTLQQSDPHYMCHYGYGQLPPPLKRRNTWHHHKDQVETITTSV